MVIWLSDLERRRLAVAFASGFTLILASLANFLSHNGYSYFRPEVGILALGIVILCAGMAFFYFRQRRWGRSVLEGLLAALFIDLNTDSVALASIVGLAVGLFTLWRRFSLIGPMALIGAVILFTTMLGLGEKPNWISTDRGAEKSSTPPNKPALLHIILDEHIGVDGLPGNVEGKQMRDELRNFYLANGFALYGGAYSQHYETVNAIPKLLNLGEGMGKAANKKGLRTGRTKYLQTIVNQGYNLTIYQSDYVDYCEGAEYFQCITYDSSSLRPTLDVPMPTKDRAGLLTTKFLALSDAFEQASSVWNVTARMLRRFRVFIPQYDPNSGQSSTVGALGALDVLSQRVTAAQPGDVIFAHLLLPHFPYVVRSDCGYVSWTSWQGRYLRSTVEARRHAYYDQIRCTNRKIRTLLSAFSRSAAGGRAIVVINGDHGSRIVRVPPYAYNHGKIDDADMIAGFSTIFAIRAPGLQAAYIPDRQPVAVLLREFAASGFRSAPRPRPPAEHFVYLADKNWKPVRRVSLPESWLKAQ